MGLFTFAESPQLQALLGDIAPPSTRDASYAIYFALAFGVGSLWLAVYGAVIKAFGDAQGVPIVFGLMAVTFVLAALGTVPIRAEQRARENAVFEANLGVARPRTSSVAVAALGGLGRRGTPTSAGWRRCPGAGAEAPAGEVHAERAIAMATSAASGRILSRWTIERIVGLPRSNGSGTGTYVGRLPLVSLCRQVPFGHRALSSAGPVKRAPSVGAWRSLVARIVRDDEVGGSNPLAPTKPTSSSSRGSDETSHSGPRRCCLRRDRTCPSYRR